MKVELELTDAQVDALTDALALKIGPAIGKRDAYSVEEAAERIGVSRITVHRRVKAGLIPTLPGISPTRIPADFVLRMMNPTNG